MANLYQINSEILNCIDQGTGEVIDLDMLRELQLEREQKIENIALWIKNLESDAEQYAQEEKLFEERKINARNKANSLKQYLLDSLQGEKFKTIKVGISYRSSTKVVVDDWHNVPEEYLKYKEPEVNKTEIKNALKRGEEVAGARLEPSTSIVIK